MPSSQTPQTACEVDVSELLCKSSRSLRKLKKKYNRLVKSHHNLVQDYVALKYGELCTRCQLEELAVG